MDNQIAESISKNFNTSSRILIDIDFNKIQYNITILYISNYVTAVVMKTNDTTNIMHIKKVCDDGAFGIMFMIDEHVKQNDILLIREIAQILNLEYISNENRADLEPLYNEDLFHMMKSRIWINTKNSNNITLKNILNMNTYNISEGIAIDQIKKSYEYSINLMWIWDKNKYDNTCAILPINTEWYVHNKSIVLDQNEINNNIKKGNNTFTINDLKFDIDNMQLYKKNNDIYSLVGKLYKTHFYDNIKNWSMLHPNGKIVVWYDSKYINFNILIKTRALFYEFNKQNIKYGRIHVKNIRSLSSFKEIDVKYPYLFSEYDFLGKKDFLYPIYLRIDLAKHIIAYHCIKHEFNYFIYADLDMVPQNYNFIFKNKKQLDIYGMIKAVHNINVENSFIVFGSNIKTIKDQVANIIYNIGIMSVIKYIEQERSLADRCTGGWSYMSNGRVEHIPDKYHPNERINNCIYLLQETVYAKFKQVVRAIYDNFVSNHGSNKIKEINTMPLDILYSIYNRTISYYLNDDMLRPSRFT